MPIYYDAADSLFHLQTLHTSYLLHLVKPGYLQHVYWGKKIQDISRDFLSRYTNLRRPANEFTSDDFSLDVLPQEYPAYGNSDLRSPAFQIQMSNGSTITETKFKGYTILKGKKPLQGLPACYVENDSEAQTLEITLADELSGLEITLCYTVYEQYDAITRSVSFRNASPERLKILRALSANVDFGANGFDLLQLSGSQCSERGIIRRPVVHGGQSIESRRGASSAQQNPFIALLHKNTDEEHGEVYGLNLVYSGNFLANVEENQNGVTRIQIGINPFDFSWLLEPGETFQAPETVLVYSDQGIGGMSRIYHRLYRERLCRGVYRDRERPILINTWEAAYFNVTKQKVLDIAAQAKALGIELLVLDDGWFGHRNNDKSSLGDWYVNTDKFPGGLEKLVTEVHQKGLQFGLWFEPEMISPDSDLYRNHPDWCLHVHGRRRSQGRNQLILDLSRDEVCKAVIKMVSQILSSAPIAYVKWDMNRNMTEIGSETLSSERQRETAHRYILGLYRILEILTSSHANILFESCASGGDRFDPGMLFYMPQTWTSDNTDACDRLKIQYGTSIVYPVVSITSHVSDVPNFLTKRTISMETRGLVAMSANMGYELDVTKISGQEKEIIRQQIATYRKIRRLVQFGDLYRLLSPFEGNETAWMYISGDRDEAVIFYFQISNQYAPFSRRPDMTLRLQGLSPEKRYAVCGMHEEYGGDELMYAGLVIPCFHGDFQGCFWHLKSKDEAGGNTVK